ncbi:leucine-rich_repeat domain-containing protein [Hexamita inflata]|uniref:Leucine-rich repeat domain-containing protein n=1 Tax=Hexamita inflata TaxID=28002 RepID=A0AA86R6H7_9EUKA|nr:leucine-rich repeat domain-containing protein [Hexamita inflata]
MNCCGLQQLSALKLLINLSTLNISNNSNINITILQYLKNLTHLNLLRCNLVSIYVLRPLVNLEELRIANNKIVYLDANLNKMNKLEKLSVKDNLISNFFSLEQYQYFNNIRNFNIQDQQIASEEELHYANQMKLIENTNFQLQEIQNKRKRLQTVLNECKKQINAILNCHDHIQFSTSVAHLFEMLNNPVSM